MHMYISAVGEDARRLGWVQTGGQGSQEGNV